MERHGLCESLLERGSDHTSGGSLRVLASRPEQDGWFDRSDRGSATMAPHPVQITSGSDEFEAAQLGYSAPRIRDEYRDELA